MAFPPLRHSTTSNASDLTQVGNEFCATPHNHQNTPPIAGLGRICLGVMAGISLVLSGPVYAATSDHSPSPAPTVPSFQIAQRLNFRVDNIRTSPSRIGGFARGDACFRDSAEAQRPIALFPITAEETVPGEATAPIGVATTVEAHPTFFVYVPELGVDNGEFTLWSEDQSDVLAIKNIQLPAQAGVIPIAVPEDVSLEVGKTYYWTLEVLCNEDDRSRNTFVEGLVQRVPPTATLVSRLEQVEPRDRLFLYVNAGLWYEALTTLAQLRTQDPTDTSLQADWETLLDSANLDGVADAPLLYPVSFE